MQQARSTGAIKPLKGGEYMEEEGKIIYTNYISNKQCSAEKIARRQTDI